MYFANVSLPSEILKAEVTSSLKLTCPGVSMILSKWDFPFIFFSSRVTGIDLIDTPLSCSTNNVSVYLMGIVVSLLIVPGCVWRIRQSTNDVLPKIRKKKFH